MAKARWNARENAPDTEIPATDPGARHRRRARAASARARSPSTSPSAIAAEGFTVGVLDADIWGFSVPRMLGVDEPPRGATVDGPARAEDHPERAARRRGPAEGRVDGLPRRRRGHRAHVAGAHAHQGGRAVPARRALGRPRLPAHRHAARHRRRADGPGPPAAAHRPDHRHDAGAWPPRRSRSGPPTWPGGASCASPASSRT